MFSQRLVDSKIQKTSRSLLTKPVFFFAGANATLEPSTAGAKRRRRQALQAPSAASATVAKRYRCQAPQVTSAAGAKCRRSQVPQAPSAAGSKCRRRQAPQACCSMAPNRKLVAQAQRGSRAFTRRGVYMCSITRRGKATVKCVWIYTV